MTRCPILSIPRKEIQPDFFFRFASESDLSRLKASILNCGIRTPLWVRPAQNGYALCSGFRRFFAAGELGLETVPAQIIPEEKPPLEWLVGVLLEHMSTRPLNLVEKAKVLRLVQSLLPDAGTKGGMETFTDLLDVPEPSDAVAETLGVLDLHPDAVAYIERHDMPVKSAKRFFRLSREEQGWLAKTGSVLSIRPVELFEIGSALLDVSMRKNRTLAEQIRIMELEDLLNDTKRNRNQKIERLRSMIEGLLHPTLVSFNEKLDPLGKNAGLPPGVRLTWDRSLETPGVRLEADIPDAKALERLAEWFSDLAKRKAVEEMLKT
jgi:hypothetical protein